ncbi:hypothetical protein LYNGBM3L_49590 [Moorena producens 3L]|uniref:Uncharacterized protein n=1 Tax=Moorena producens 3L TaxID=489825 RepID=F4XXX1_9CYAN|nr:hypothetical protein LYNGBM3L_49590 [Moorena producens 3L]OLT66721.1 hypothetical protein BI334_18445 [Moorena producens 3L]
MGSGWGKICWAIAGNTAVLRKKERAIAIAAIALHIRCKKPLKNMSKVLQKRVDKIQTASQNKI